MALCIHDGKHLRGGRVLLIEGVALRDAAAINLIAQHLGPLGVG